MNSIVRLLGEAQGKMNGYVALLALRYSNLCVKAEAASLLSVTITLDGQNMNIEDVADVALPDKNVLAVVPKDSSNLLEIGKCVMKAHPEFKMDIVQNEKTQDEEDKYLTFTMPEVDKARHDVLTEGVDGLQQQCTAKLDAVNEQYIALISAKLVNADPETIDKVKDKLKELHDFFSDTCNNLTDTKKKEIEDAYQVYVAEQEAKKQELQEEIAAHNQAASQSMKMGSDDDDDY